MPRNQGTSRKGKPKKQERAVGMGRALERSQQNMYRPKANGASRGGGGMMMTPGVTSVGFDDEQNDFLNTTKSMLEVDDLTDFMSKAQLAQRVFASEHQQHVVVDTKGTAITPQTTTATTTTTRTVKFVDDPSEATATPKESQFTFTDLAVPRRPPWDASTTPEQLDRLEIDSFLEWRRAIAVREEQEFNKNSGGGAGPRVVTPFEKNLQVWRQLWRVLERCQVLVQILDARNPLFYLNQDLRKYVTVELKKPMLLLLNKSDFLTPVQRKFWHDYLTAQGFDHVFFSAHIEQEKLDQQAVLERRRQQELEEREGYLLKSINILEDQDDYHDDDDDDEDEDNEGEPQYSAIGPNSADELVGSDQPQEHTTSPAVEDHGVENLLTRAQLLDYLQNFARQHGCEPSGEVRVPIGMVGFPNVGKSSVINVLVASSKHTHGTVRVGVAAQPGKTKHFQTLFLPENNDMMLCDCPGLVFPSFVSNTADLIAAGVYPIAQMRDHWPVVELICQRIPRPVLEAQYGINLPVNPDLEPGKPIPPPTAEELLTTYCITRAILAAASGAPDYFRAARTIIKDYAVGRLLYCHMPPTLMNSKQVVAFQTETVLNALQRTKKLRDKLLINSKPMESGDDIMTGDQEHGESLDDMLDLKLTDSAIPVKSEPKPGRKLKSTTKRGRQGRQLDPYGCNANPDDDLLDETTSQKNLGVVVNAGKYGRSGYTRPTSYAGARSAPTAASISTSS